MSALQLMLPKVWACSTDAVEGEKTGTAARLTLSKGAAASSSSTSSLAAVFRAGERKQPHGLRLVRAQAEEAPMLTGTTTAASGPILLRKQPRAVGGVSYEFYRQYTEALLRRYVKMSMEAGRVPSMLGRELFRGHASSYKVQSFEDVSNFVIDVERCLAMLDPGQRHLVRRIALEEYTLEETAAMCGMSLSTVVRRYREALDRVTRVLLDRELMRPLLPDEVEAASQAVENTMGPILVKGLGAVENTQVVAG